MTDPKASISMIELDEDPTDARIQKVKLEIANRSETAAGITTSLTQIHFDSESRTLLLNFGERDIGTGARLKLRYALDHQTIGAGETASFERTLFTPVSYVDDPLADHPQVQVVKVPEDIDRIDCVVEIVGASADDAAPQRIRASWTKPVRS
jgi:hypothetical protein